MIRKYAPKALLTLSGAIAGLFLCDSILWVAGYPSRVPARVSHPPDFVETRDHLEFQYTFRTNSAGLRYREVPLRGTGGDRRVFVCGDSFTEGVGVETESRFTELLEKEFGSSGKPALFLNGGLEGTGPLEYFRLFMGVGLRYAPAGLMVCIYANDVSETPEKAPRDPFTRRPPARGLGRAASDLWPRLMTQVWIRKLDADLRKRTSTSDFVSEAQERAAKNGIPQEDFEKWKSSLPPDLVAAVNEGRFNGSILSAGLLNPGYWTDSLDVSTPVARAKWANAARYLDLLVDCARALGIEAAVVFFPCPFQHEPGFHREKNPWVASRCRIRPEWLASDTEFQALMRSWAGSRGVPFLDLTPVFRERSAAGGRFNFELDGHWNAAGHALAAEAIAGWLKEGRVYSFLP